MLPIPAAIVSSKFDHVNPVQFIEILAESRSSPNLRIRRAENVKAPREEKSLDLVLEPHRLRLDERTDLDLRAPTIEKEEKTLLQPFVRKVAARRTFKILASGDPAGLVVADHSERRGARLQMSLERLPASLVA